MIEGIHFFKTRPEEAIDIIQERYDKLGKMNREQATITYQSLARILEPKLYPKMRAIANVYEEAVRRTRTPGRSIRWSYGTCSICATSTTPVS